MYYVSVTETLPYHTQIHVVGFYTSNHSVKKRGRPLLFLPQVMKLRGSGILVSSDHWSISDSVCLKVLSQFSSHLHKTCNTCSVDVHGILIFLFKFLELSPFFKCFYKSVEKVCCPNSLHSCLSHLIADSSSKVD